MAFKNKKQQTGYQAEWLRKRKRMAIQYLGGACVQCGYNGHYAALQFHHKDPATKTAKWSKFRGRRWSFVLKELDKCELLCTNCHLIHHAKSKYD